MRLGRVATFGLVAGLVLYHGQLLWQRIASFTLLEPMVALRWGAAALVLAGFVHVQRSGVSVFRGHRALALWLLVLVLHAGAAGPPSQPVAAPELLLAVSLWGFALRALLGGLERRVPMPRTPRLAIPRRRRGLPTEAGFFQPLSPRPPPARFAI